MAEQKEYLTKDKFTALEKELEQLKKVRRKEVAESLEYAKSLGDLSENAEYQEAREMQENLEERIAKLESVLQSAVIVSERHGGAIGVGSTVVVKREGQTDTRKYHIVGSEEADSASGKISNRSPLGEALLGKKKGESARFMAPKGNISYEIISVE